MADRRRHINWRILSPLLLGVGLSLALHLTKAPVPAYATTGVSVPPFICISDGDVASPTTLSGDSPWAIRPSYVLTSYVYLPVVLRNY